MSSYVSFEYWITFGTGDAGDRIESELEIDGDAERAYLWAKKLRLPLEDVPELQRAMKEAEKEIAEAELENLLEFGDEYVTECLGRNEVDPDEINDLVAERDPHALAFFALEDLSGEELDEWDANDLEELPRVRDFDEDFEEIDPLDEGYDFGIEYSEHPEEEELEEDEAREMIAELIAAGDLETLRDYVERCSGLYAGEDLRETAEEMLRDAGIFNFFDER